MSGIKISAPPLPPLPVFDENFDIVETPPPLPELSLSLEQDMITDLKFDKYKESIGYKSDDDFEIKRNKEEIDLIIEYNNYKMDNGKMRYIKSPVHKGFWFDMFYAGNDIIIKNNKVFIKKYNKNHNVNSIKGNKYFTEKYVFHDLYNNCYTAFDEGEKILLEIEGEAGIHRY